MVLRLHLRKSRIIVTAYFVYSKYLRLAGTVEHSVIMQRAGQGREKLCGQRGQTGEEIRKRVFSSFVFLRLATYISNR